MIFHRFSYAPIVMAKLDDEYDTVDAYAIYDRRQGHREPVGIVGDVFWVELIVNKLNQHFEGDYSHDARRTGSRFTESG